MRNYLSNDQLPEEEMVRTEEYVNYFDYHYPKHMDEDFKVHTECGPSIFGDEDDYSMLKIGIRGRSVSEEERRPTLIIFVIDISGSMADYNKLDLIRETLPHLVEQLEEDDRIGIVVYGTNAAIRLEPTGLDDKKTILNAIEGLASEGSTNAEDGIRKGYEMADDYHKDGEPTRILLLSDGVANQGIYDVDGLVEMIEGYRDQGIYLSTYGFGMGVYNDELMEQLADNGDGKYGYIDSEVEARREFVKELSGNLETIAKDLKIQVTFDEQYVKKYRLLGYENRLMDKEDFDNYSKDAGDIGAGHTVTALYEIELRLEKSSSTIADIAMRYKEPETGEPKEITLEVGMKDVIPRSSSTSPGFRFAQCVAEFAEYLSNNSNCDSTIEEIIPYAREALEEYSYKAPEEEQFLELLSTADSIDQKP
jgi:Ca-activated chloride channel family protein